MIPASTVPCLHPTYSGYAGSGMIGWNLVAGFRTVFANLRKEGGTGRDEIVMG